MPFALAEGGVPFALAEGGLNETGVFGVDVFLSYLNWPLCNHLVQLVLLDI